MKEIESHPDALDAARARRMARVGGVLYLLIIVIGGLGESVVRGTIVVPGNAAATVANLRSMESLWRLGVAGEVVLLSCTVALAVILYALFRNVSRYMALGAVFLNLIVVAIEGVAAVALAAALFPLSKASYLKALAPEQIQALVMMAIRTHSVGFAIALVFFGLECFLLGYLLIRSEFMPRILGVLMTIAGACYLINSFAVVLSPWLSSRIFPAILLPALVGELSFALWLVVKGVRVDRFGRRSLGASA